MSFFSKLFGSRDPGDRHPPRDIASLVNPFSAPGVQVLKTSRPSGSFLGGNPMAATEFGWPEKNGVSLGFLGRIDLAEVAAAHRIEWLPDAGGLLFFYDIKDQPWGFDPRDAGSWRVVLTEPTEGDLREVRPPPELSDEQILTRSFVSFRRINTLPTSEREEIAALTLTDEEIDLLVELQENEFAEHPRHQLGGFPIPVQGDIMELESQLVSNGLYCGDASGYEDPRAQALAPAAKDWRLLFQFDSDDDLGACWGDAGTLYFWVREQDARAMRFDGVWLVLQSA